MTPTGAEVEALAADALEWMLTAGGPDDEDPDPTLYSGAAGIAVALLDAHAHFDDDRYAEAAVALTRRIADEPNGWELSSLYFGLVGRAVALHAVADRLGESWAESKANHLLSVVRSRFDGERWGEQFELLGGNAGIGIGALTVADLDLAVLAVTPYLRTAEPTAGGVNWEVRAGTEARFHHISHGTLGIATALAAVGAAAGRQDLVDLAVQGAADVVSRNEKGDEDFLVPHSDPQHRPELIERYSYGWCHGPAGDAQAFRLLGRVTGDPTWGDLVERCWHTVVTSGLPQRLRPGFWDNNARCCGTAGVLALALDRVAEGNSDLEFASVLVEDLAARAGRDAYGARWSNYEHRVTPSDLEPRPGWAQGNAGIVRELLRYARIVSGGDRSYAVQWPDQPAIVGRFSPT